MYFLNHIFSFIYEVKKKIIILFILIIIFNVHANPAKRTCFSESGSHVAEG